MSGFSGYQGKGLYWRNTSAEYGRQSAYLLKLQPGDYKLDYVMAAWKSTPKYKVSVLDASNGSAIATSEVLTATPNANGNQSANLSSAKNQTLLFTVSKQGNYVIKFTDETSGTGMHEFLLLECRVSPATTTGIDGITLGNATEGLYDLNGRRVDNDAKGVLILRSADGTTRKIIRK